ncbi:hypothetical protein BJX63DRAFT_438235 [Aspergillus granulosus]|uniref:Uncharacterized protein n=1 Tax=Aspergillus granulosus TaxID=176169 RepID=A0ABR4GU36_9EURO
MHRVRALAGLAKWETAATYAYMATRIDPKYVEAWESYEQAIKVVGAAATDTMRQGLAREKSRDKQAVLRNEFADKEWEIARKSYQIHSLVHERQAEGLLLFAEHLKWPYLSEARDRIETAYSRLRSGQAQPLDLFDWILGTTLSGKWFSSKIMCALILCTPSLAQDLPGVSGQSSAAYSVASQGLAR